MIVHGVMKQASVIPNNRHIFIFVIFNHLDKFNLTVSIT